MGELYGKELKFILMSSGKVIGGFVTEKNTYYEVEGCYIQLELHENTNEAYKEVKHKGKVVYQPFSPVGGLIQRLNVPKDKIDGFLDMPESFVTNFRFILGEEIRGLRRKQELLNRKPSPMRAAVEPEDYLAFVRKYTKEHGKLPIKEESELVLKETGIIGGRFSIKPTSPYRPTQTNNK